MKMKREQSGGFLEEVVGNKVAEMKIGEGWKVRLWSRR